MAPTRHRSRNHIKSCLTENIKNTDNIKWGPVLSHQLVFEVSQFDSLLEWWQEEWWFHENRLSLAVENVIRSSQLEYRNAFEK